MLSHVSSSRAAICSAVLLAVAAAGVGARSRLPWHAVRPVAFAGTVAEVVVAALVVAQVVLFVLLLRRFPLRRRPGSEEGQHVPSPTPVSRWARPLALAGCLALLAAPWLVLALLPHHGSTPRPAEPTVVAPAPAVPAPTAHPVVPHTPAVPSQTVWPLLVLAVVLLVLLTATVVAVVRIRRGRDRPAAERRPVTPSPSVRQRVPPGDPGPPDGPRAAVIRSWVALGEEFSRRGVEPAPADTPARLLSRAQASGAVTPDAGLVLARLFREARFSSHAITRQHQQAAEQALRAAVPDRNEDR